MLDMSKEVWSSNASALKVPNHTKGLVPVGNPLDGKIYIRGGYHTANADMMEIYDPKLDNYTSIPIPKITATTKDISQGGSGVPAAQWYSAVWSVKRSSVLYFGGRVDASDTYASAEIYEYKPALNQWGVFNTTGTPPTSREDACLAMDQNNSKLAVYGGRADDNLLRDIFVLDLASMQWSKGPSSADGRVGMACIMYDDGFLVWGGAMDTFLVSLYSPDPSVFNLTTMQWSTVYRMANTTVVPPVVGSTGKSSTFALILGLTMGAIGLGAIGAGMLLYRREKNKSAKKQGRMILQIPAERVYEPSQGSPTPLVGTPPTGTDGISMTALQSPDIPQTTSVPSTATQCGATKREVGAGRMDDDISIRTQLSGKYDEREEEKLSASQQPYRSRRRKKRTAQYQEQDTGHKIELDPIPSTTNDPVVSASKQEDPTFQPLSSRMRPDAALSSAHMHPDRSHLRRSFAEDPDEQRRDPPYNPHHHAR
ncbi:hypothetical protein EDD11_009874 [Mortierella claussenii]|nr:hypothetical protein EDD11_009874 [Mortierella claussenii]